MDDNAGGVQVRGEADADPTLRLLQDHLKIADSFDDELYLMIEGGRDFGRVATRIQERLGEYRRFLETARTERHRVDTDAVGRWTVEAQRSGPCKVIVFGPGDDRAEIETKTEADADLMMSVSA